MGVGNLASCTNPQVSQLRHHISSKASEISWTNPPSSLTLQSKAAPPGFLMKMEVLLAGGLECSASCRAPRTARHFLCWVSPPDVSSGNGDRFGGGVNLGQHSGLKGHTLGMECCVPPPEALSTKVGTTVVHQLLEMPSISYLLPALPLPRVFGLSLLYTEQASSKSFPGFHQLEDSFTSPSDD